MKTLQRCRSPRILQGFGRRDNLRRTSALTHRVVIARSAGALESFDGFKVPKISKGTTFLHAQSRTHSCGVRGDKAKFEAFEDLEFFQVQEESA
jgi:hypothetical protein